jgi:hypothetical protein
MEFSQRLAFHNKKAVVRFELPNNSLIFFLHPSLSTISPFHPEDLIKYKPKNHV